MNDFGQISILQSMSTGIIITDDEGNIKFDNCVSKILNTDKKTNLIYEIDPAFKSFNFTDYTHKNRLILSNEIILDIQCSPLENSYWLMEVFDVSSQVKQEEDVYFRANYDQLTELPNRALFNDRLKQAFRTAERHDEKIALLFIDLDDFKYVNDTFGHDAGDKLLIEVANRLNDSVRESDTVSRWAGDEFTILLPKIKKIENIDHLLNRIFNSFKQSVRIKNEDINIPLSIGICVYPDMCDSIESLSENADQAMFYAKKSGKNQSKYYSEISSV